MTPEQIEEINKTIELTIVKVVNGKIDKVHCILEKQNETMDSFHNKVELHIEADNVWKKEYTPYIKGLANATGGIKILVWIAVGVSAIIGAIIGVKEFFK